MCSASLNHLLCQFLRLAAWFINHARDFKLWKSHPPSCVSVLSFSLVLSFPLRPLVSSSVFGVRVCVCVSSDFTVCLLCVTCVCACVYSDRWMTSCLMADVNNLYLLPWGWYTSETGSPSVFLPLGDLLPPGSTPQLATSTPAGLCSSPCACLCCRVTVRCNTSHYFTLRYLHLHAGTPEQVSCVSECRCN